jgi:hypothetical protein
MPQTPFLGDLVWLLHHPTRGVEVSQLLAYSILDTSDKIYNFIRSCGKSPDGKKQ